ncbi:hypothetical protein [Synechococcus sp. PCC 7336]|uniref:hypothetical protein n=1 Tax=Synechococcus sp. PCC 7336 TaxID=195250 RepID=UPI000349CD02|nr:hypothetical protein [Synechococcus sp. PCC 7336]
MPSPMPLTGTELIDCARANASLGLDVATESCGYKQDTEAFEQALKQACSDIGVSPKSLEDLLAEPKVVRQEGVIIAPDSPTSL